VDPMTEATPVVEMRNIRKTLLPSSAAWVDLVFAPR